MILPCVRENTLLRQVGSTLLRALAASTTKKRRNNIQGYKYKNEKKPQIPKSTYSIITLDTLEDLRQVCLYRI